MDLDIDIEGWPVREGPDREGPDREGPGEWETLAGQVAEAAIAVAPELGNARLSASLLFTSDEHVHELNREWRGKDKPTNVLSFPMLGRAELLELAPVGPPEMLGDLALAYGTCAGEAAAKSRPLADHTAHLILHGLLHLAGYDHETGQEDADKMEALEITALAKLGIADPYGDYDL